MLYFANPCSEQVRAAMADPSTALAMIATPHQGNELVDGAAFCLDNGCFSDKWDAEHWWSWLVGQPRTARFAVAPDVVADWPATLERFNEWEPRMHAEGFRVAVVAQDGATTDVIPWGRCEAVFIGGSTDWKLGADVAAIVAEANRRGVWAHMGRVNSLRRLRYAADIGCDSVDGTFLVFAPDHNWTTRLLPWLREVNGQASFGWGGAA